MVDMARSVKVDKLSTSKAVSVSSVGLQVGYKQLKHKQNEAVKEFVSGSTGSSKSLCYAVLPAVNVRSPLHTALQ